ncbi:hypothetical protein DFJ77DRAFT_256198 [Powellomyces hirtus]|nr:hypothetical protein DFJ77DRAFT_256198 [Powellomyces hirtus]
MFATSCQSTDEGTNLLSSSVWPWDMNVLADEHGVPTSNQHLSRVPTSLLEFNLHLPRTSGYSRVSDYITEASNVDGIRQIALHMELSTIEQARFSIVILIRVLRRRLYRDVMVHQYGFPRKVWSRLGASTLIVLCISRCVRQVLKGPLKTSQVAYIEHMLVYNSNPCTSRQVIASTLRGSIFAFAILPWSLSCDNILFE